MNKFKCNSKYRFLTWSDFYNYIIELDWRILEGIVLISITLNIIVFIIGLIFGIFLSK